MGGRVRDRENTSEYVDPSFWLKECSIMSEFIYRIQDAMKKSYSHINLFLKEFSGYLEMVKRQESTDYSNLTTKKF